MFLYQKDIFNCLNLSLETFLSQINKRGKAYASVERVELIFRDVCARRDENPGSDDIEIDFKSLKKNIRKMLGKNPPEKILIGKVPFNSSGDLNMSVDSADLDSSTMSFDSPENDDRLDPLFKKSKRELVWELKIAKQKILDQDEELNALRPLSNFLNCIKKRGAFTYGPKIDRITVGLLCEGETGRGIERFFNALTNEFPVFLKTNNGETKKQIPRKSYINSLRDIMPEINTLHLADFLEETDEKCSVNF